MTLYDLPEASLLLECWFSPELAPGRRGRKHPPRRSSDITANLAVALDFSQNFSS